MSRAPDNKAGSDKQFLGREEHLPLESCVLTVPLDHGRLKSKFQGLLADTMWYIYQWNTIAIKRDKLPTQVKHHG